MSDFRASHVVPAEGLVVYAAPDPGQPTGASLDPGLEVAVVEAQGPWSRIECSNGFTGWVDGRRLVAPTAAPAPAPVASAPGTPTWAIVAILVILAATVVGILSTLGGDDEEGGQPVSTEEGDEDVVALVHATHPPGRDAVFFTLEAPSDRFDAETERLRSVPGLDLG